MKILITGANGQLGFELQQVLSDHELICPNRENLDITNQTAVENIVENNRPEVIIHAAAYTAVDQAERDQEQAMTVNRDGSYHLALAARTVKARLIAISTDYVFDGRKQTAYSETDQTRPLNVYGASKLAGEEVMMNAYPEVIILRSAWLYGGTNQHKNFVRSILRKVERNEPLRIVNDQVGSPTAALHLARVIREIIGQNLPGGIYHAVNAGQASWFTFGEEILNRIGKKIPIELITTEILALPAKRPPMSVLSTKKLEQYGFTFAPWQEALTEFLEG